MSADPDSRQVHVRIRKQAKEWKEHELVKFPNGFLHCAPPQRHRLICKTATLRAEKLFRSSEAEATADSRTLENDPIRSSFPFDDFFLECTDCVSVSSTRPNMEHWDDTSNTYKNLPEKARVVEGNTFMRLTMQPMMTWQRRTDDLTTKFWFQTQTYNRNVSVPQTDKANVPGATDGSMITINQGAQKSIFKVLLQRRPGNKQLGRNQMVIAQTVTRKDPLYHAPAIGMELFYEPTTSGTSDAVQSLTFDPLLSGTKIVGTFGENLVGEDTAGDSWVVSLSQDLATAPHQTRTHTYKVLQAQDAGNQDEILISLDDAFGFTQDYIPAPGDIFYYEKTKKDGDKTVVDRVHERVIGKIELIDSGTASPKMKLYYENTLALDFVANQTFIKLYTDDGWTFPFTQTNDGGERVFQLPYDIQITSPGAGGEAVTYAHDESFAHKWHCDRMDDACRFNLVADDVNSLRFRVRDAENHSLTDLVRAGNGRYVNDTADVTLDMFFVYEKFTPPVEQPQHLDATFTGYYRKAITDQFGV